MSATFEDRPADSPLIETIWRTRSAQAGMFTSLAASNCELVVTTLSGKTHVTLRGPETRATRAQMPPDGEFFGVVFKLGTFMPHFPARTLLDRQDMTLPQAGDKSFWLYGSAWEIPTYENVDIFIRRLIRDGVLVRDPLVTAALEKRPADVSIRTLRRRFLQATGLTHSSIHQIERARYAMSLLRQGRSILDTVFEAGYFDQPHMTRALKHFVGQTPARLTAAPAQTEPVSFLYKTSPQP